jgi:hypothetical protein
MMVLQYCNDGTVGVDNIDVDGNPIDIDAHGGIAFECPLKISFEKSMVQRALNEKIMATGIAFERLMSAGDVEKGLSKARDAVYATLDATQSQIADWHNTYHCMILPIFMAILSAWGKKNPQASLQGST